MLGRFLPHLTLAFAVNQPFVFPTAAKRLSGTLKSFELAWRAFVHRLSLAAVEMIMPSDGLQVMVD